MTLEQDTFCCVTVSILASLKSTETPNLSRFKCKTRPKNPAATLRPHREPLNVLCNVRASTHLPLCKSCMHMSFAAELSLSLIFFFYSSDAIIFLVTCYTPGIVVWALLESSEPKCTLEGLRLTPCCHPWHFFFATVSTVIISLVFIFFFCHEFHHFWVSKGCLGFILSHCSGMKNGLGSGCTTPRAHCHTYVFFF